MSSSTKKNFLIDVSYFAVSKYTGIIVSIIISAILARILSPEDYGIVAIATVFIVFFNLFSDMGISPAIVQNQCLTNNDISDIFGVTFWMGIILGGLFYIASSPIAHFYNHKILEPVCQWLSLVLFFSSINIVPEALLYKDKKFKIIAVRNFLIQILCGLLSVIAAFRGMGIYALLLSPLLSGFFLFSVNEYFLRQKIHILPSLQPIKKIFSFSAFQFLSSCVNFMGNNLSSLIIGKVLSVSELGIFDKATRVIQIPLSNINGVITPVLFPYLSDEQGNLQHMFDVFKRINKILVTISFPIAAGLCMCSREIILILYGPKWSAAILCFSIMSVTVAMQISSVSVSAVLQASGRTNISFKMGALNTCVSLLGLIIGAFVFRSIESIAIMGTISSTWSAIFSLSVVYIKSFNESPMIFFRYALKPFSFFVLMVIAGILLDSFADLNVIVSCIVKVLSWMIATFIFLKFFTQYNPIFYINVIKTKYGFGNK